MRMLLLFLFIAAAGRAASSPYQLRAEALDHFTHARYREAEAGFRGALDAWSHAPAGFERERAAELFNLGSVLRVQGRFAESEPLLREALAQMETLAGPESLDAGRAAAAMAALYQAWGRPAGAEPFARRAYTIFSRHPEAGDSDRANGLLLLASSYIEQKRAGEAEELLQRLLNAGESRAALRAYNDLAAASIRSGDLDRAESLVRRALEMAPAVLPDLHPLRAAALNNLAQVCRFRQRYLEAEQHYRAAIAIWEAVVGPRHPDTAKGMLNLAALLHERGRERAAEDLYRRAAAIFQEAYGDDHDLTLIARAELAEVLRSERRYTESKSLTAATLPALEDRLGSSDPRVIRALDNYQRLLQETRR